MITRTSLTCLALAIASAAQNPNPFAGTIPLLGATPCHTRVIWTESPQSCATISWSTVDAGANHKVYYDTQTRSDGVSTYAQQLVPQRNGRFSGAPTIHFHHAQLTNLRPATTYYFVVQSDKNTSREYHFTTAPSTPDATVSILATGDSRSNHPGRRKINGMIRDLAAKDPKILALAHGGDYVGSGQILRQWVVWMSHNEDCTGPDGRLLPIIPARGNHEAAGPLYDEVWCWPGGGLGSNYYKTMLSPQICFITLNSETAAGGNQSKFLRAVLMQNLETRWKIAQYHTPIWPAVKARGRVAPFWSPLFDHLEVNLVIESDGHTLKRTVPIMDSMQNPRGVVYIGEGGAGVKQRIPAVDRWYLQPPGMAMSALHIWRLDFDKDTITGRAFGIGQTELDRFTVKQTRPQYPSPRERDIIEKQKAAAAAAAATAAAAAQGKPADPTKK